MTTPTPERKAGASQHAMARDSALSEAPPDPRVLIPASGIVAGMLGRVEQRMGAHRSVIGEPVVGPVTLDRRRLSYDVLAAQGVTLLGEPVPGQVRLIAGRTRGLGALGRLSARRLVDLVQRSVLAGTDWARGQPADAGLRDAVARDVRSFLGKLWRSGVLPGRREQDAYRVCVDDALNNHARVLDDEELLVGITLRLGPRAEHSFIVCQGFAGLSVIETE